MRAGCTREPHESRHQAPTDPVRGIREAQVAPSKGTCFSSEQGCMQSSEQAGWTARGKGTFPSGFLDDVRHAAGIATIVEQHVALKRAGRTLKGLCPFHSEK